MRVVLRAASADVDKPVAQTKRGRPKTSLAGEDGAAKEGKTGRKASTAGKRGKKKAPVPDAAAAAAADSEQQPASDEPKPLPAWVQLSPEQIEQQRQDLKAFQQDKKQHLSDEQDSKLATSYFAEPSREIKEDMTKFFPPHLHG